MAKESSNELAELIAGKAKKVILWQDPVFSGVTFAIGLAGFLFMGVRCAPAPPSVCRGLTQS